MSRVQLAAVPLDLVTEHQTMRRDLGDLQALAASIDRFGVLTPIVVERHSDALRVRFGHRRVAAARMAGLQRIPALIHAEPMDEVDRYLAAVHENTLRRGYDDPERRDAVSWMRRHGCTWAAISQAFGLAPAVCRSWLMGPRGIPVRFEGRGTRR